MIYKNKDIYVEENKLFRKLKITRNISIKDFNKYSNAFTSHCTKRQESLNNSTERISIFLRFECKIVARFVISRFRIRHSAFCHTITGARIPERREQPMKELVQRRPSCAALLSSSESRGGDVRLAVYADCRAVTDSVPRGPRDFPL